MKLQELTTKLNLNSKGNLNLEVQNICSLTNISSNGISFTRKKLNYNPLIDTELNILVLDYEIEIPENKAIIIAKDPYATFVNIIEEITPKTTFTPEISNKSMISESAKIGTDSKIFNNVTIMDNVQIGNNALIYPNVVIYPNVKIGNNSIIHSGVTIRENCEIGNNVIIYTNTVIGTEGFGYIPDPKQIIKMVPQIGKVIIEDDVHIGSNSCIDRGTFGNTLIKKGVKIDNLVQIGHNVQIGNYTLVCGCTAIAGSTKIGNFCVLGGRTSVSDHVQICDKARFGGQSLILADITEPGDYAGSPVVPVKQAIRNAVILRDLNKYFRKLILKEKN